MGKAGRAKAWADEGGGEDDIDDTAGPVLGSRDVQQHKNDKKYGR